MRFYIFALLIQIFSLQAVADPYTLFTENGKVGLKNEAGLVVIQPQYEALGWSNGSFSVNGNVTGYKLKGGWGVISISDQRITPPAYTSLSPAESSLIIASKESNLLQIRTGCINTEGKTVIPFMYAGIKVHAMRVVAFIREGNRFKHGLVDLNNRILIPFEYRNIYPIGSLRYAVEDFNGKTALYSESGRQITGFDIDSLSDFRNNLAIIYESGKMGLINREGQLQSEAKYREIELNPGGVRVRMPDQWQIFTAENKLIETIEADSISWIEEGRYKIQSAGRSWLTNAAFKKIHNETFQSIGVFQNARAIFKSGALFGVMRKNGSVVLPPNFSKIILGDDYMLTFEKNIDKSSWTLRDTLGQRKTTKLYDVMCKKTGLIFPVKKNGFWGGIDFFGNEIIACVYDSLYETHHNQVAVKFKGMYGIISLKEEWLAYPQPHPAKLLNPDRYFKKSDSTLFLCSFNGTILYFTNNQVQVHENFLVESVSNGGTWTIDFDGRIISRQLPPSIQTEEIFPSSEGLRGIRRNGKYGFIDDQGRLRIANRYESIMSFSEGLAGIKIRNKWGFINRDEKIVIQPNYEEATPFHRGYSLVKQNGLFGLIDTEGKVILPTRFHSIRVQDNGRLLLMKDGMQGLADAFGNVLLHPKYVSVEDLNNGFVIVQQNGKFGLTTLNGVSTVPTHYDWLTFDRHKNTYFALQKSQWLIFTN